ncbi:hypothetical protein SAMN06265360_1106 [Haloechinothrix alba]|uniref:Uncharacterized protein n=2 Tax=Haloechinothrix alba TaxID=664784 RepID=A0A238X9F4_9PSEU|nr:hypothetical protein SAMN06265360_1106 [Haloechinothrix alba]
MHPPALVPQYPLVPAAAPPRLASVTTGNPLGMTSASARARSLARLTLAVAATALLATGCPDGGDGDGGGDLPDYGVGQAPADDAE